MEVYYTVSVLKADEIKEHFKDEKFSLKDLYNYYCKFEPDLKETTFRWRVYQLKNAGVIRNISRGIYEVGVERLFNPKINKNIKRISRKIKKEFPYTNFAIWDTSWLSNYMIHQPLTNNIILEVESASLGAVFDVIYSIEKNVLLDPNKLEIERYMLKGESNIILKTLTAEAPIAKKDGLTIPKIEKILVDLFTYKDLYIMYQGKEKVNIFENVYNEFTINNSTLKRYAVKRGVYEEIYNFIKFNTNIELEKKGE